MKNTIDTARFKRRLACMFALYAATGCSGLQSLYEKEARAELARFPAQTRPGSALDGAGFASETGAVWHERSGDFEYVTGRIVRIVFDVSGP